MLQASIRPFDMELRPWPLQQLNPRNQADAHPPMGVTDPIQEALRQVFDELEEWSLITEASLSARGLVALDPLPRHRLGWQEGDRIRVILEEDHLRLVRVP